MKYSIALFAFSVVPFAQVAFAQSGLPGPAVTGFHAGPPAGRVVQSHPASTFGSNTGWGSVANPGTGHPPNTTPGGFPRNNSYGRGAGLRNKGVYVGGFIYGYPTYIPGYYDSVTANPQDQVQYYPQQADPYQGSAYQGDRPTVVIQNFYPAGSAPSAGQATSGPDNGYGNMQTYRAPAATPSATPGDTAVSTGNYFLIATKDHHVYSVLAYWTEGTTFHYVTTQNAHNQTPLDSIDVDMTKRLNQDSNMNLNSSGQ